MAPTALSSFHHIEAEKIGQIAVPQVLRSMKKGETKSSPQQNKPQTQPRTWNFFWGNDRPSTVQHSERIARGTGISSSFSAASSGKPSRLIQGRPKDHDGSYLFGTPTPQNTEVKIPQRSSSSFQGIQVLPNRPGDNSIAKEKSRVNVSRPKDHDTSYLFGTSVSKSKEAKPVKYMSASETRGFSKDHITKEKPRISLTRPKDHDTSYLFGTPASKCEGTKAVKHRSAPEMRPLQNLAKDHLTKETPRIILRHPKDHDTSYFFGNATITNNSTRRSNQPRQPPCSFFEYQNSDQSLLKEKCKLISNRPKDHDTSYLFGAPASKSNCVKTGDLPRYKKTYNIQNNTNANSITLKPRVSVNRPHDHGTSYLFGTSEHVTGKTNSAESKSTTRSLQHNFDNYTVKEKPKALHHRPKDHDKSYLFGISAPHNESSLSDPTLASGTQGLRNRFMNNSSDVKPRSALNRPKDHDKSYLFGTHMPKSEGQKPSPDNLAKLHPKGILNRPKDHDPSYLFGAPRNNNDITKYPVCLGMRELHPFIPKISTKDKLNATGGKPKRCGKSGVLNKSKNDKIKKDKGGPQTSGTQRKQGKSGSMEMPLKDKRKTCLKDASSKPRNEKEEIPLPIAQNECAVEAIECHAHHENTNPDGLSSLENLPKCEANSFTPNFEDVKKLLSQCTTNNNKSSIHHIPQSLACKYMHKDLPESVNGNGVFENEEENKQQEVQLSHQRLNDGQQ